MQYLDGYAEVNKRLENFVKILNNCIEHTAIDTFEWEKLHSSSTKLQDMEYAGNKLFENYSSILEDVFFSLYKLEPRFSEDATLDDDTIVVNKPTIEKIQEMSSFEDLRTYTMADEMNSAVAMVEIGDVVHDIVKEIIEALEQQRQEMQDLIDSLAESVSNANSDEDLSEEDKEKIQQLMDMMAQSGPGNSKFNVDVAKLSDAIDKAMEQAHRNEEIKITWGLEKNDSFQKLPYKEKIKLFEKLRSSHKLNKIAEMLGKFTAMISTEHTTTINTEINSLNGTTRSNEITKAIPAELMRLNDPDLEYLLLKDMANHNLETFEYENDYDEIKGPIVIAIDESGSMAGTPEIWSKACALAVIHQAKKDNRSVFVIHFAYQSSTDAMHVNRFPKDEELDIKELIDMAEHFYNGGTSFEQPLFKMMECINTEEGFERADGLFITDGYCRVSDSTLKTLEDFKEDKNFKLLGIEIGHWGESIDAFCNHVYKISELTDGLFMKVNSQMIK